MTTVHEFKPEGSWEAPEDLPEGLEYDVGDGVARIRLARPERLNALTFDTYEALRDVFAQLASDEEPRSVLLTGSGRGFCSGGDVEEIIGPLLEMEQDELEAFTTLTCDVVRNMRACPQPIVAALNGTVAGAGAALAIASDIRVAVPEATISFLFTKTGLSGADMGACHLLQRLVGLGHASELLLLGEPLDATQAQDIGLYNRVVSGDDLEKTAYEMARHLASGPRQGMAVTKKALDTQAGMNLDEALTWDADKQAACMQHPDFEEAYRAFMEDRDPRFE